MFHRYVVYQRLILLHPNMPYHNCPKSNRKNVKPGWFLPHGSNRTEKIQTYSILIKQRSLTGGPRSRSRPTRCPIQARTYSQNRSLWLNTWRGEKWKKWNVKKRTKGEYLTKCLCNNEAFRIQHFIFTVELSEIYSGNRLHAKGLCSETLKCMSFGISRFTPTC